jgi:hypothetical protein
LSSNLVMIKVNDFTYFDFYKSIQLQEPAFRVNLLTNVHEYQVWTVMIPKPFWKCQFLLKMRTINFQCKIFWKTGELLITTQLCSKQWPIHVTQDIRSLRGNSENFVINSEWVRNLITKTYSFLNIGFSFLGGGLQFFSIVGYLLAPIIEI